MRTADFPFYRAPYAEFNPVQAAAIPHVARDVNIVVSAATGKTLIAECAFAYHLTEPESKVAYVSPLRSLSLQKYESWVENDAFKGVGVTASTGDVRSGKEDLERARLLVLTVESFDAKTRNENHQTWLGRIACLVIDEAHIMGQDGRGDRLEAALMRFAEINPKARMILLSGTLANVGEIASWVKSLNGKDTVKISSRWRPSEMRTSVVEIPDRWGDRVEAACAAVAEAKRGEKTIVFVHSKAMGRDIVKSLRSRGIRCAFHNAGISRKMREKIEIVFDSQISGMDVIVSTSTLSAGINLGS